jgi:hypothetical protein
MLGRGDHHPLNDQHIVALGELVIGLFIDVANDGNLWLATSPISRFQTLKSPF